MTKVPLIAVDRLAVRAGGRTLVAVSSWRLSEGEAALLIGPSGSGKTTLLHALAGLLVPSDGEVTVAGQVLGALRAAPLDRFRGAHFGIVFQTLRLVRALTVEQNLALALALAGKPKAPARIAETLARVNLSHLAKARPERLSVGEGQRAAIARAVVTQPRVILADEPTSALDDANAEAAVALLQAEAKACGAGLVIATHDGRIKPQFQSVLELRAP